MGLFRIFALSVCLLSPAPGWQRAATPQMRLKETPLPKVCKRVKRAPETDLLENKRDIMTGKRDLMAYRLSAPPQSLSVKRDLQKRPNGRQNRPNDRQKRSHGQRASVPPQSLSYIHTHTHTYTHIHTYIHTYLFLYPPVSLDSNTLATL
jgi:hypothetical protein